MNLNEMRQAVKLLASEWNLGKRESGVHGNLCAWIYLFEVLSATDEMILCKKVKI